MFWENTGHFAWKSFCEFCYFHYQALFKYGFILIFTADFHKILLREKAWKSIFTLRENVNYYILMRENMNLGLFGAPFNVFHVSLIRGERYKKDFWLNYRSF